MTPGRLNLVTITGLLLITHHSSLITGSKETLIG